LRLAVHSFLKSPQPCRAAVLALAVLAARDANAQSSSSPDNQYRVSTYFSHPIGGRLSGALVFDFYETPENDSKTFRIRAPNLIYKVRPWLDGVGGLFTIWTRDDPSSGDSNELRPFVGAKVYLPNAVHVHLYDLTRFEWRRIDKSDDGIQWKERLRTRVGAEFPLSARAWQPRTFYGIASVEPFIDVNEGFVEELRFGAGAGYVRSDRLRLEFLYMEQLQRSAAGDPMTLSDNIFRLNIRYSFKEGLLHRQTSHEP
jgi:Protein of unknown function (DUF2490)